MGAPRGVEGEHGTLHFPDGDAGVARALMRSLIPASADQPVVVHGTYSLTPTPALTLVSTAPSTPQTVP